MASNSSDSRSDAPSKRWYAVVIGVAIVSSAVIAFFVRGGMTDIQRLRERKQYLRRQNKMLKKRARRLELRRRRLHQDPHLIEDIARDRLGLVRPGEHQVKFKETGSDTTATGTSPVQRRSGDTGFTRASTLNRGDTATTKDAD